MAKVNTIRRLLAALVQGVIVLECLWLFDGIGLVNSVTEAAEGDHENLNT